MNQVQSIDVNHHTNNLPVNPRRVRNIRLATSQTDDQFEFTAMEVQEERGNLGIIVQSTNITSEISVALDCCYCFVACFFLWRMFPPKPDHLIRLLIGGLIMQQSFINEKLVKTSQIQSVDVNHHTNNLPTIPRRVRDIPLANPQTDDQFDFTTMEVQEENGNLGIIVQSTNITSEISVSLDCCYCFVACFFLWKMFPPKPEHLIRLLIGGYLRFVMISGQILRRRCFSKSKMKKIRSSWKYNTMLLIVRVGSIIADLHIIWTIIQSLTANIVVQIVTFTWNILHLCGLIIQQSFINEKLSDKKKFRRGSSTTQTASV
ncbi:unnamed protein product [Caenorhabditis brenneri]